ncbi:MAG TPA: hypothetical protein VHA09_05890 [Nitrososphaera sp.]|nr:hypothetical protein [Nitrososphaera sp.]
MIFSGDKEVAEIKKERGSKDFRLSSYKDRREWLLTNDVHGEPRPFSFSVHKLSDEKDDRQGCAPANDNTSAATGDDEVFVVREQLFKHNGNFYMFASHPKDKSWDEHVHSDVRYISKLDGFDGDPELAHVDYHHRDLRDKTKRLRGTAVGEASGLGIEGRGHRVRVDDELADVGLFIAAISYLLYASA